MKKRNKSGRTKADLGILLSKDNRHWEGFNIQETELTRISWEEIHSPSHDTIAKAVLLITKAENQSL